jgi:chemotaxis protein MotB
MPRARKQPESDEQEGAAEWMVTFSDCMTLLLTFFVLMLTFSSFGEKLYEDLRVIYSTAFANIGVGRRKYGDAPLETPSVAHIRELDKGSEQPTSLDGLQENLMTEERTVKLNRSTALLISSKVLFWGNGKVFSSEGRQIMDLVAALLKKVPSRMVISETGPADGASGPDFGLARAWAVMEYLTKKHQLERGRFSISQSSGLGRANAVRGAASSGSERTVEVVFLERNIYN